jgi:hypothetical protein
MVRAGTGVIHNLLSGRSYLAGADSRRPHCAPDVLAAFDVLAVLAVPVFGATALAASIAVAFDATAVARSNEARLRSAVMNSCLTPVFVATKVSAVLESRRRVASALAEADVAHTANESNNDALVIVFIWLSFTRVADVRGAQSKRGNEQRG